MKKLLFVPALFVALLLVAAAGMPSSAFDAEPLPLPEAPPVETVAVEAEDHHTIVDVAVRAGQFETLVAAVKAAGLAETLMGEGPFTVFAPTDEAFAALPHGTVDNLLEPENRHQLRDLLTYHVVPGRVMSGDLLTTASAQTVNGAPVTFGLQVAGANVIKADVKASNGVIHVIDRVIMPN